MPPPSAPPFFSSSFPLLLSSSSSSIIILLFLLQLFVLPSHAAAQQFSSLCRSAYPDPGAFSTDSQCNDAKANWPQQHQFCLPENWGVQCGSCLQTCYHIPTYNNSFFLPFQYTFPALELFGQTCDVKTTNSSSLGIYCCKPCKLYRLVTERCGHRHIDQAGQDQSCFLENATAQQQPQQQQEEPLPLLRAQSSLDNSYAAPHWLFIPPTPNRGIEDTRTNFSLFQQAWRLALDPAAYLVPLEEEEGQDTDTDKKKGKPQQHNTHQPFNNSIIPLKMGLTNIALGLNQANQRSQHQVHIHYAALPIAFRNHILTQAHVPVNQSQCTAAAGLKFAGKDVSYFAWFFPWDLAVVAGGDVNNNNNKWDFRDLALRQCAPLREALVRDAESGKVLLQPPPLPFAPAGSVPFPSSSPSSSFGGSGEGGGGGGGGENEAFLMSQVAVIIAPGFAIDTQTHRPRGHYVLMGTTQTNFHAETLLCTQYGIDIGWEQEKDCPSAASGWPQPLIDSADNVGGGVNKNEGNKRQQQHQHQHHQQNGGSGGNNRREGSAVLRVEVHPQGAAGGLLLQKKEEAGEEQVWHFSSRVKTKVATHTMTAIDTLRGIGFVRPAAAAAARRGGGGGDGE